MGEPRKLTVDQTIVFDILLELTLSGSGIVSTKQLATALGWDLIRTFTVLHELHELGLIGSSRSVRAPN